MSKTYKVTFTHLDVDKDGDYFGEGEFYYSFELNGQKIAKNGRNNATGISSGQTIPLQKSLTFIRDDDENKPVYISGSVSERDSFFTGEDDHAGSFRHVYRSNDRWGIGEHSARLKGDGLDVTVHYLIE